ncbi:prepilin-type N-terminal cleavage/methylation domain-containing protein [Idiomarina aquatica]|uniref:Type II secretory pathway, pseudopilin n=1 Tax=Idiomarina aquatica TaxID=1327752 RepID=A0AA94EGE9_9GAMM|nr:type II secretion system protein [Idiomarina aquatica]RUO45398.1 Type II secretory pathway, pseudopilin [Idiomarina aquatica]
MRNQKGFTLIELIIVIVVLGILAVTAAPQFINFSSDARTSTVNGLLGSAKAASEMVHGKALINSNDASVSIGNGNSVDVTNGYPAATEAGIFAALDVEGDWDNVVASGWSGNTNVSDDDLVIFPTDLDVTADGSTDAECYVVYRAAVADDGSDDTAGTEDDFIAKPVITAVTNGC